MRLISEEEFKKENSDLIQEWSHMSKEELLEELVKESTDAINMNTRVQLFMNECSNGMSKTTYTLDVIENLIQSGKETDIREWCRMTLDDSEGDSDYILNEVKTMAQDDYLKVGI